MAKKVTIDPAATEVKESAEVKATTAKKVAKNTTAKKEPKKLTPEESVVILACMNKEFLEKLNKLAEKEGVSLVLTNEQVIMDYVAQKNSDKIDETARMTAFLRDERNRKVAFAHASEMFRILTRGKVSKDKASDITFSKKELVHVTTLSWNKAEEMLNTLEAFGFVVRIDKTAFKFHFDYKDIRQQIYSEVILSVESVNHDIQRFKGALENSNDLQEDEKTKAMSEIQAEVAKNIVF